MDKYRPCPSIIAMFTSDSQHPPRSKHAVYLGEKEAAQVRLSLHMSKCHIVGNHMSRLICHLARVPFLCSFLSFTSKIRTGMDCHT